MLPKVPKSKLKSASRKRLKKARIKARIVDNMIWLNYLLMMKRLANAAEIKAKEEKQNKISLEHINAASKAVLKSCKG